MCKCQVRDRWKISPKCLWEAVSVSAWLQNRSGGWRDELFVMVRTSVFAALKITLYKSEHISNWRRSLENVVCNSYRFAALWKTFWCCSTDEGSILKNLTLNFFLKNVVKEKMQPEKIVVEQLWNRKSYFTVYTHINETQTVLKTEENGQAIKDQNCFSQSLLCA